MYTDLTLRTQELISRGLKTCGLDKDLDAFSYIEEELYVDEANEVRNFIKWLFESGRPYGPGNAQIRWGEFNGEEYAPIEDWLIDLSARPVMLTKKEYETKFKS